MNIEYNAAAGRFEAQFSTDFQGDLAAVKTAGFKCDGPPSWMWHTVKLTVLNKLRQNKPISGLTISEPAYEHYMRLTEMERVNTEARKLFAPIAEEQKKAKKERKRKEIEEQTYVTIKIPHKPEQAFDYLGAEDLPPFPPCTDLNIPPHSGPWCTCCGAPLYFYEKKDVCLWCEKSEKRLDTGLVS